MKFRKPVENLNIWRKNFAIIPTYVGEQDGERIIVWLEYYEYCEFQRSGNSILWSVKLRPLNASSDFISHVIDIYPGYL